MRPMQPKKMSSFLFIIAAALEADILTMFVHELVRVKYDKRYKS